MKNIFSVLLFVTSLLASCGGGIDGTDLSKEVCDRYNRANGLPANDPGREQEQDACIQKQGEAWKKVKDDIEESDKFNKGIADCSRGYRGVGGYKNMNSTYK